MVECIYSCANPVIGGRAHTCRVCLVPVEAQEDAFMLSNNDTTHVGCYAKVHAIWSAANAG